MKIEYTAAQGVRRVISSLGRTEDVRFSPGNRRLAVAAFTRNLIAVFDIDMVTSAAGTRVELTGGVELSSPALHRPHGLDFIDDDTLVVANREGDVVLFRVPPGRPDVPRHDVLPIQTLPVGGVSRLKAPGSVSVMDVERDRLEMLICNNDGHEVTRHVLEGKAWGVVSSSAVLLRKWLNVPDGVSISRDRRWIAVSNHNTQSVLVYENGPSLNPDTDPDGILRGVHYPHGLRFSANGHYLLVADAAAPHVRIFASDGLGWHGVRHPVATIGIMDESLFLGGRHSAQEGGPKGLDVDGGSNVLVVTCESQPLAFFDLPAILRAAAGQSGADGSEVLEREKRALDVGYELHVWRQRNLAEAALDSMKSSRSWRLTAPFRRILDALRRLS